MKKVMLAAMAGMVLVSGASANVEMDNYLSGLADGISNGFIENAAVTVGAGWANTDAHGGAGFVLNLSSAPSKEVYSKVDVQISERYFAVTDIAALNLDGMVDPYLGFGYLKAEGVATTGGGCAPGSMFNGTCLPEDVAPQSSEVIKENGFFGTVGVSEQFVVDGITAGLQAGYRFGAVEGPVAGATFSKKIGSETGFQALGLMVNFEQIKNDKEDIDRVAVYGTVTF
jgi:hypothetical protein